MSREVPKWLTVALGEVGTSEVPGNNHNPRIVEYHKATTLKATQDEVPWCASYLCWCLEQAGVNSTASAAARSYLKWGQSLTLDNWKLGAVAVFSRGANPASGHVGFVLDFYGGMLDIISGNHSNRVRISKFGTAGLLGLRWPK